MVDLTSPNSSETTSPDDSNQNEYKLSASKLIQATNESSAASRNAWLALLGLLSYLIVTLASVTHKDLLLNSPINLPLVNVNIPLFGFYLYAPILLFLIHTWVVLLHVFLTQKIRALNKAIENGQGHEVDRLLLHSSIVLQGFSGPERSYISTILVWFMILASIVFLPIFTFLYFQISFLPYHDIFMIWWHRVFLIADIFIILSLGILLISDENHFTNAIKMFLKEKPKTTWSALTGFGVILCFSLLYATHPDEWIEKYNDKLPFHVTLMGDEVDFGARTQVGIFSKNIVLPYINLADEISNLTAGSRISLRGRDLRSAVLIEANLSGMDGTGTNFANARLEGADLSYAKFRCAIKETNPDAQLAPRAEDIIHSETCSSHSNLGVAVTTSFRGANLTNANFEGSDLTGADLSFAIADGARLVVAELTAAKMVGIYASRFDDDVYPSFMGAKLAGANLSGAWLSGNFVDANFVGANLTGAVFFAANTQLADFTTAKLHGTFFGESDLSFADFTGSQSDVSILLDVTLLSTVSMIENSTILKEGNLLFMDPSFSKSEALNEDDIPIVFKQSMANKPYSFDAFLGDKEIEAMRSSQNARMQQIAVLIDNREKFDESYSQNAFWLSQFENNSEHQKEESIGKFFSWWVNAICNERIEKSHSLAFQRMVNWYITVIDFPEVNHNRMSMYKSHFELILDSDCIAKYTFSDETLEIMRNLISE